MGGIERQGKAEQGLELSLLGVIDVETNKAYALNAKQTPPLQEIKKNNPEKSRVDFYLNHLRNVRPFIEETKPTTMSWCGVWGRRPHSLVQQRSC